MKQLPDVPTSVEQGFTKYVGSSWSSIVVPAKTPQAIIDKINADITTVINDPSFRDKLEEQGAEFMSANANGGSGLPGQGKQSLGAAGQGKRHQAAEQLIAPNHADPNGRLRLSRLQRRSPFCNPSENHERA